MNLHLKSEIQELRYFQSTLAIASFKPDSFPVLKKMCFNE